MKKILITLALGVASSQALATEFKFNQLVTCLLKDNLCGMTKPTQGPVIDNGAQPWFYPVHGKDFGATQIGTPVVQSFLVANIGTGPLTVYGFDKGVLADSDMAEKLSGYSYSPTDFRFAASDCPLNGVFVLGPSATCTLNVRFLPGSARPVGDVLKMLHSSAEVGPVVQDITGTGLPKPIVANPGSEGPTTGGDVISNVPKNEKVSPAEATAALEVSTAELNFGQVPLDSTSPTLSYVLHNKGTEYLALAKKQIINGLYTFTDNCPTQLNGGQSCTFNVQIKTDKVIKPSSIDSLEITTKEGGNTKVSLKGLITGAEVYATPDPAVVSSYQLDTAGEGIITIFNNGTGDAVISNIQLNDSPALGGFTASSPISDIAKIVENNCATKLAPKQSCSIRIQVKNSTEVEKQAYLQYQVNGKSQSVAFTAKVAELDLAFTPATLDMGSTPYYTPKTIPVAVKNIGGKSVKIVNIKDVPAFSVKNNTCLKSLADQETCTFDVVFTPTVQINPSKESTLVVYNDGDVGAIPYNVKATAYGPVLFADKTSISFANIPTGSTSNPETITLSNKGTTPVAFSQFSLTSPTFSIQNNTCGTSLPVGASCSVSVIADTRVSGGTIKDNLIVKSNALSGDINIALDARINGAVPTFTPSTVEFGTVAFDSVQSKTATLKNTGDQPFKIIQVSSSGQRMGFDTTCGAGLSLSPGQSCTLTFQMDTGLMSKDGASRGVNIATDSPKGTVSISASGLAAGPYLNGLSSTVSAPTTRLGSSKDFIISLSNGSYQALSLLSNPTIVSGYGDSSNWQVIGHDCTNVQYNKGCGITVRFTPSAFGERTGLINIKSNDPRYANTDVQLTGMGVDGDGVVYVDGTPASTFNFGKVNFGTDMSKSFVLKNEGTQQLKVTGISGGAGWTIIGCNGLTLSPAASCSFSVSRTAAYQATESEISNTLTFSFDTSAPTNFVLTHTPKGAWHTQSATTLAYGDVVYNTQLQKELTFTNTGTQPLNFTGNWTASPSSAEVVVDNSSTCGSSIPAKATCKVVVNYTTKTEGAKNITLTRQSDSLTTGTNGILGFNITANGLIANPIVSMDNTASATSTTRQIYLFNKGTSAMTLQGATVTSSSGSVVLGSTSGCTAVLAKGYCTITATVQGNPITANLNLKFTGGPGSDGNGNVSLPLVINPEVTTLMANAQLEQPGFYPTSSVWYTFKDTTTQVEFADGNLDTFRATSNGYSNSNYGMNYGILLNAKENSTMNKVVLYVENPNNYAVNIGIGRLTGTWAQKGSQEVSASLAPNSKGYITINTPGWSFGSLANGPVEWYITSVRYTGCYCATQHMYDVIKVYEARVIQ